MRRDRGTSPVELALGIFLLLFPMTLLVLGLAPWVERRNVASRLASEAARLVALDPTAGVAAAVTEIQLEGRGLGLEDAGITVSFCGRGPVPPAAADPSSCHGVGRGEVVTVAVTIDVPTLETPLASIGGMRLTAVHAEAVDPYRSLP